MGVWDNPAGIFENIPVLNNAASIGSVGNPLNTLHVKEVVPATSGTFIANGATNVVITTPEAAIGNIVAISLRVVGGTVGAIPKVTTITPGTSFTVAGTASDTSTYNWAIIATV